MLGWLKKERTSSGSTQILFPDPVQTLVFWDQGIVVAKGMCQQWNLQPFRTILTLLVTKRIFLCIHNTAVLCQVLPHYHSRQWESSVGAQTEVQENSCQGNLSRGSGYQVSDKWQRAFTAVVQVFPRIFADVRARRFITVACRGLKIKYFKAQSG